MTAHRWFRYPAFVVIVGFAAVISIAGGGTAINIGHGIHLKNVEPIARLNDWDTQLQWAPAALGPTSSAANPRPAHSGLFIAYHSDAMTLSKEGSPQVLYADTGPVSAQNNRSNHKSSDSPRVATPLHIQF